MLYIPGNNMRYELPDEQSQDTPGLTLLMTLEEKGGAQGQAAVVSSEYPSDPQRGIFSIEHGFGIKLIEADKKCQYAVIQKGQYKIRGKVRFELPENRTPMGTTPSDEAGHGESTDPESTPMQEDPQVVFEAPKFDTSHVLPEDQQPDIYWLEKFGPCPDDGAKLEKEQEYIQLNDENQKLSLWKCETCGKRFAVIPFGAVLDEFRLKTDYLPKKEKGQEAAYYSPYYSGAHTCTGIIKNRDFVNAAVIGTKKYYDFLSRKNTGLTSVPVREKKQVEDSNDYELFLDKNLKAPENVQIQIGEKVFEQSEIRPIEYSQEEKRLTVRVNRELQQMFDLTAEKNIQVVFDLKFLVRRVENWYRQYGFMLKMPNQTPRIRYPNCQQLQQMPSPNQSEAIHNILSYPFTYIWGAPGTGKTQFVLARSILAYIQGNKKVLVLAPTNNAIEQTLNGLLPVLKSAGLELNGLVLRLGVPSTKFAGNYPKVCENATFARLMAEISDRISSTRVKLQEEQEKEKRLDRREELLANREKKEQTVREALISINKMRSSYKNWQDSVRQGPWLQNMIQSDEKEIKSLKSLMKEAEQKADAILAEGSGYQKGLKHLLWPSRWEEAFREAGKLTEKNTEYKTRVAEIQARLIDERENLNNLQQRGSAAGAEFDTEKNHLISLVQDIKGLPQLLSNLTLTNMDNNMPRIHGMLLKEREDLEKAEQEDAKPQPGEREEIRKEIQRLQKKLDGLELESQTLQKGGSSSTIDSCQVIASTIDTFMNRIHPDDGYNFDHIFLDEAGYCSTVKAATATAFNCPVTLLGDHMQLPPICEMDDGVMDKEDSKETVYWSQSALYLEEAFTHTPDEFYRQYRCNDEPAFFYLNRSMLLYTYRFGKRLADALAADVYRDEFYGNEEGNTEILYIDAPGQHIEKSRVNKNESRIICNYVLEHRDDNIGIITPYNNQVYEITSRLRDAGIKDPDVVTVHGSQGKEWDTVLFSVVDTADRWFSDSTNRKGKGLNLINTAVSRTKKRLVIVCDCDYWKKQKNQFITDLLTIADGGTIDRPFYRWRKTPKSQSPVLVQIEPVEEGRTEIIPDREAAHKAEKPRNPKKQTRKLPPIDERVEEIYQYLTAERRVKYLVHFTVTDNLPGIMKNGILPRKMVPEGAVCLDEDRLDQMKDCGCFSLSFPNYRMFYLKRIENRQKQFAVLLIDIDALRDIPYEDMYFYPGNAADSAFRGCASKMQGLQAVEAQFTEHYSCSSKRWSRADNIPAEYTTNPQSEVLLRGIIPAKYIREIQVLDQASLQNISGALPQKAMQKVRVTDFNFKERMDGYFWSAARC